MWSYSCECIVTHIMFIQCRSVSVANDSTMQCIPLAPPTTMSVTTMTPTTMITTPSQTHTTHTNTHTTTHPPTQPLSTDEPITQTTSEPTEVTTKEELPWTTVVVPIIMTTLLLILLVGLVAICYRFHHSKNKSQSKILHDKNVEDVESDINSYKTRSKISLRDLSSRRLQNFVRTHSPIKSHTLNSSGTYNMVPVEESLTKLLKHSPTLSDTGTHGARSSFEGRTQTNYYNNSTFPHTMHPGVYSTRDPPSSHPHRCHTTYTLHKYWYIVELLNAGSFGTWNYLISVLISEAK